MKKIIFKYFIFLSILSLSFQTQAWGTIYIKCFSKFDGQIGYEIFKFNKQYMSTVGWEHVINKELAQDKWKITLYSDDAIQAKNPRSTITINRITGELRRFFFKNGTVHVSQCKRTQKNIN